jgi:hypothetical protein
VTVSNCTVSGCTTKTTIAGNLTAGILTGVIANIGTTSVAGGASTTGSYSFVATLALNNITVTNCTVQNCPGYASAATYTQAQNSTGILFCNTNNSTISYNFISGNGASEVLGNAGIEFNWCSNSIIEFNEVYNQISSNAPGDGDGVDLDVGCQSCTAQYNYIHHCGGSGIAYFNFNNPTSFTHSGCVARFNICENNMQSHSNYPEIWVESFSGGTGPTGIEIYNNTVYNSLSSGIITVAQIGPSASGSITGYFCNNIIMEGTAANTLGVAFVNCPSFVTNGNYYYATGAAYDFNWQGTQYSTFSAFKTASSQEANGVSGTDPKLNNPGSGGTVSGYNPPNPTAYELQATSPCIGAGLNLSSLYSINPGSQDFYGNAIPNGSGSGYNVGAYGATA